MLVLTRKQQQEIVVDGNIKIRVLQIKGNSVRIGIEAPAEVSIKRGELKTNSRTATNSPQVEAEASFTLEFDPSDFSADLSAGQPPLPLADDFGDRPSFSTDQMQRFDFPRIKNFQ